MRLSLTTKNTTSANIERLLTPRKLIKRSAVAVLLSVPSGSGIFNLRLHLHKILKGKW
jgi:hypothetical protein